MSILFSQIYKRTMLCIPQLSKPCTTGSWISHYVQDSTVFDRFKGWRRRFETRLRLFCTVDLPTSVRVSVLYCTYVDYCTSWRRCARGAWCVVDGEWRSTVRTRTRTSTVRSTVETSSRRFRAESECDWITLFIWHKVQDVTMQTCFWPGASFEFFSDVDYSAN